MGINSSPASSPWKATKQSSHSDEVLRAYGVTHLYDGDGDDARAVLHDNGRLCAATKDFKYRNSFRFYIYFTTLFGGGLVPGTL